MAKTIIRKISHLKLALECRWPYAIFKLKCIQISHTIDWQSLKFVYIFKILPRFATTVFLWLYRNKYDLMLGQPVGISLIYNIPTLRLLNSLWIEEWTISWRSFATGIWQTSGNECLQNAVKRCLLFGKKGIQDSLITTRTSSAKQEVMNWKFISNPD